MAPPGTTHKLKRKTQNFTAKQNLDLDTPKHISMQLHLKCMKTTRNLYLSNQTKI
jgi:hypothetical protein